MPPTHPDWTTNTQSIRVTNKLIADSTCPGNNCGFTYQSNLTSPSITLASATTASSGKGWILLTGNNLAPSGLSAQVVLENKISKVKTVVSPVTATSTAVNFTVPNV